MRAAVDCGETDRGEMREEIVGGQLMCLRDQDLLSDGGSGWPLCGPGGWVPPSRRVGLGQHWWFHFVAAKGLGRPRDYLSWLICYTADTC